MKVLMLILASDGGKNEIYTKLQDKMRKYVKNYPNIEVYFYKADPSIEKDYSIVDDTIYLKTEETYPNLWKKFWLVLKAFETRLHEFSYISRPNLSTFIIMDRYLKHLSELPRKKCCDGIIFYGGQHIPFPSGYLFTFTPDIAKEFIYNDVIENNEGIDDRCVGFILHRLNIQITPHNNYIEVNNTNNQSESCLERVERDESIFMIRIRNLSSQGSLERPFGEDSEDRLAKDFEMHNALLKIIYNIDETI